MATSHSSRRISAQDIDRMADAVLGMGEDQEGDAQDGQTLVLEIIPEGQHQRLLERGLSAEVLNGRERLQDRESLVENAGLLRRELREIEQEAQELNVSTCEAEKNNIRKDRLILELLQSVRIGGGQKVSGGAVKAAELEEALSDIMAALAERKRAMDLRLHLESKERQLAVLREELKKAKPQDVEGEIARAQREVDRMMERVYHAQLRGRADDDDDARSRVYDAEMECGRLEREKLVVQARLTKLASERNGMRLEAEEYRSQAKRDIREKKQIEKEISESEKRLAESQALSKELEMAEKELEQEREKIRHLQQQLESQEMAAQEAHDAATRLRPQPGEQRHRGLDWPVPSSLILPDPVFARTHASDDEEEVILEHVLDSSQLDPRAKECLWLLRTNTGKHHSLARRLAAADADGDGLLTVDELIEVLPARPKPVRSVVNNLCDVVSRAGSAGTNPGIRDQDGHPLVAWVDLLLLADQVGKPPVDSERLARLQNWLVWRARKNQFNVAEILKAFENRSGPDDSELLGFLTNELGISRDDAKFLAASESLLGDAFYLTLPSWYAPVTAEELCWILESFFEAVGLWIEDDKRARQKTAAEHKSTFVTRRSLPTLLLAAASEIDNSSSSGDIPCSVFADLITRLKLVDSEDEAAVITSTLARDVSDPEKLANTGVNVFDLENHYAKETWRKLMTKCRHLGK
ncbi:hypothetical protein FOZ61_004262 [Perkinsus olseni]|uniref:EF-hand domain-containing protein n=1 Tax=Perkinsus olseni TaxID=32597 RepID=A0A7J6LLK7_PEROL|nr:hypothetical protein FOZ61_004262 [Perkinsus olseni]